MRIALHILCYHRLVSDDELALAWPYLERGTAVRMSTFRAQLHELEGLGDILSEQEALEVLAGERSLHRPAAWLTFDDGYRDVLRVAPLVPGTAFVTTCTPSTTLPADAWYSVLLGARRAAGEIDLGLGSFAYDLRTVAGRARLVRGPERRRYLRSAPDSRQATLQSLSWQLDAVPEVPPPYLGSADLRVLVEAGWAVGSHGVTHTPFDELAPRAMVEEAVRSRDALTHRGVTPRTLALPDGALPADTAPIIAAGYECVLGLGHTIAERGAAVQARFIVPDDPFWIGATLRQGLA
jgi:hypothetical protein